MQKLATIAHTANLVFFGEIIFGQKTAENLCSKRYILPIHYAMVRGHFYRCLKLPHNS